MRPRRGGLGAAKRRLYAGPGGRPTALMRLVNRLDARLYAAGRLVPAQAATLEVVGRRSGRAVRVPVAVVDLAGERYLVAMLGERTNWVRNVRAAGGRAALHRRVRREVVLEEVPVERRAPVLQRYLAVAPGARAHIPVHRRAPVAEFERIADRYPVFRVRFREPSGSADDCSR